MTREQAIDEAVRRVLAHPYYPLWPEPFFHWVRAEFRKIVAERA